MLPEARWIRIRVLILNVLKKHFAGAACTNQHRPCKQNPRHTFPNQIKQSCCCSESGDRFRNMFNSSTSSLQQIFLNNTESWDSFQSCESLCGWTNVTSLLLKLHNEPRGVETTRCGIWRRAGLCLQPLFHSNIQIFLIHINPRRLIQFVWTYCFSAEIFHHSIRWLTAGFPVCLLNDQNYHQWLTM